MNEMVFTGILAAWRWKRTEVYLPAGYEAAWILGGLTALVLLLGLLLLLLAILTAGSLQFDPLPPKLSGERDAREGRYIALAGFAWLAIAALFQSKGIEVEGLIPLLSAAIVFGAWGGGKTLLAAGGTLRPARHLFFGGGVVIALAVAALIFEMVLARRIY